MAAQSSLAYCLPKQNGKPNLCLNPPKVRRIYAILRVSHKPLYFSLNRTVTLHLQPPDFIHPKEKTTKPSPLSLCVSVVSLRLSSPPWPACGDRAFTTWEPTHQSAEAPHWLGVLAVGPTTTATWSREAATTR